MRVLILGSRGMAGHMIRDYFQTQTPHDVWGTVRTSSVCDEKVVCLDARNRLDVLRVLEEIRPDVVINAIGVLNQAAAMYLTDAIYVNSLLPHWLAEFGQHLGFRLIHISTDCVFSGTRGNYCESDEKDGTTVYAKTKSLGEVVNTHDLTIRTSIVGPELKPDGIGLFHWFMHQTGVIDGYRKVFWNGVTTLQLAKVLAILLPASVSGLVHLTGQRPISKFKLLCLLQRVFERDDISIRPEDQFVSDKTLVNTRLDFDTPVPGYEDMLMDLKTWIKR